jgi:hypothetical protein
MVTRTQLETSRSTQKKVARDSQGYSRHNYPQIQVGVTRQARLVFPHLVRVFRTH